MYSDSDNVNMFPRKVNIFSNPVFKDYSIRQLLPKEIDYIEMSPDETAFICGLLQKYKPKNILEVGVSAGGTSAIILKCMESMGYPFNLISSDCNKSWYRDKEKETGWQAKLFFSDVTSWKLLTGKYLPTVLPDLHMKFDFCILDTVHSSPGELLDYLVMLPFMNNGAVFILHDVIYHLNSNQNCCSNRILFDTCVGEKIVCMDNETNFLPNISAIVINNDTYKYVSNVIEALAINWMYQISDTEFELYYNFFDEYYGNEASTWFRLSRERNEKNLLARDEIKTTILRTLLKLL